MDFEERVEELFLDLPEPLPEADNPVYLAKSGKLAYLSGQLPYSEGRLSFKGRIGLELTLDNGRAAARAATLQALGVLKNQLGGLNKIKRIVQLKLYVATGAEFKEHKRVLASAVELIHDIFGPFGRCATDVVGCASLPEGAAVELSLIVETT